MFMVNLYHELQTHVDVVCISHALGCMLLSLYGAELTAKESSIA